MAQTIDEVIEKLDAITLDARRQRSRIGYFSALYLKVTKAVRVGIEEGLFDDGPRMARLDVVFANRYLNAYVAHRKEEPYSEAWDVAFSTAERWWPLVLQHLLLGINAHINLDLGVAAAEIAPGSTLPALKEDFRRINLILSSLVEGVKEELTQIWPLLRYLDRLDDREDELINFSMALARDEAWALAERLVTMVPSEQAAEIARCDARIAQLGRRIRHPGFKAGWILRFIRLGERGSVPAVIDVLR